MALSLAHPTARPQPIRITGLGLAMSVNLAGLLMLSLPHEFAPLQPAPLPDKAIEVRWVRPEKPLPVQPVPPPPKAPSRPERISRVQPVPQPAPTPVIVEQTSLPVEINLAPVAPTAFGDPVDVNQPAPGMQVGYRKAPPPPYPRILLKQGVQGAVLLRVLVGSDGRPRIVEIEQSSGHAQLDRSAREHVLNRWQFEPARRNGRAVDVWALVPIDYRIPR